MSENLSREQIAKHVDANLLKVPDQKSKTERGFDDVDFAEGTDPSIAVIDDVPMSKEDASHFAQVADKKRAEFELKSVLAGLDKAAVMAKSEKDEWDNAIDAARKQVARDGETPIKSRAELQAEKNAAVHAFEVAGIKKAEREEEGRRSSDKPWMDAKDKALKNIAQQERLSATESKIETASRAVRVETEIKNNPTGPLAKLRERVRKILSGNR